MSIDSDEQEQSKKNALRQYYIWLDSMPRSETIEISPQDLRWLLVDSNHILPCRESVPNAQTVSDGGERNPMTAPNLDAAHGRAGRLERLVGRLHAATKTNEVQKNAVLTFSVMNMAAYFMRDTHPILLGIACLLFWPSIAYLINIADPME